MTQITQPSKPRYPLIKPPLPKRVRKQRDQAPAPTPDAKREELRQWVAVDGHLTCVRELLAKYHLDRKRQPEIFTLLGRIEEHEREERLFLGVVGEFSSGKSTLLNALLRDDLLRTDIIQGTTAAATLLCYGSKLTVTVRKIPSHPVVQVVKILWKILTFPIRLFRPGMPRDREGLRNLIHQSTAVEEVAHRVAQVNVNHPADCLRNGMVIIDLPGTNADNPRHGGVTAAALDDLCDAAIIVIPADAPGSETLWGFLKNHTEPDVLKRCVFILNKIDKIRRPPDRERLAGDLKARLKLNLGIENPRVVVAAPERVLEAEGVLPLPEEPEFASSPEEKARWVGLFKETEGVLWATLREQKLLLQVERLARLLGQVFDLLTTVLKVRDVEYRDRHAALLTGLSQIPDLEQFVAQHQEKHGGAYVNKLGPIAQDCWRTINRIQADTMRQVSALILGTSSKKELQAALEGSVQSAVNGAHKALRNALRDAVHNMEKSAETEHRAFHAHFQGLYRNLATLGGKVRTASSGLDSRPAGSFASTAEGTTQALSGDVAKLRQEDMLKGAGGIGGGAFIGTLIFPGIGTIVFGLLGGLVSWMFGPSFAQVRQKCLEDLEAGVTSGFTEFVQQAEQNLPQAAQEIETALVAAIGRYADQYRRLVQDMIARDEREAADLTRFRDTIQQDLSHIQTRQGHLTQARAHLRTL